MTSRLADLTEKQRKTLLVLRSNDWLYTAAAAELGIPEATVRTRVHQMLIRCKLPHRAELAYWLALEDASMGRAIDNRSLSEQAFYPK